MEEWDTCCSVFLVESLGAQAAKGVVQAVNLRGPRHQSPGGPERKSDRIVLSLKSGAAGAVYIGHSSFVKAGSWTQLGGSITIRDVQAGKDGGAGNLWGEFDAFHQIQSKRLTLMCRHAVVEPLQQGPLKS